MEKSFLETLLQKIYDMYKVKNVLDVQIMLDNHGTVGWANCFKETCKETKMDWLYRYYESLPWDIADMFSGYLSDELEEITTESTILFAKEQNEFCERNKVPTFYPNNGMCYSCGNNIFSENGFSAEYAKNNHITFCPFCNKSFLD